MARRWGGRSATGWIVVVILGVLGAALAGPVPADHDEADVGWPQLVPPGSSPTAAQPHPVPRCSHASIRCVRGLARRLRIQWRGFDRSCDHNVVIAYSYLQITRGLIDDLSGPRPELVRYRRWMTYLITTFSNRYFDAYRDYAAGRPVADAWRIAFETTAEGDANAGQDVLLFSNAHVQHDLPFALAEMGLRTPNGASRKRDHDAVNAINARVFDPIEDFIARHYDPSFSTTDAEPSPLDEMGTLELVKSWRETAWRNSERLLEAGTHQERAEVAESIDATSRAWAELISSGGQPGHRAVRDAWCREHHVTGGG
jgi:hypothetical protein